MNRQAFTDFLLDHLDVAVSNGDELRLQQCLFCGGVRTMKVNQKNGRYFCYLGSCQERGSHISLIMRLLDCSRDEATHRFTSLISSESRSSHTNDQLRERLASDAVESASTTRFDMDLPRGFKLCYLGDDDFQNVDYLEQRGVSLDSIERWGIGYVDSGLLAGRVVVPVRTDGATAWVARIADGRQGPKYRTPPNMPPRVLFGYDEIPHRPELLVGVEGVFDAIRLWSYGIPAVAYLKDGLSFEQVHLIERLRPRRFVQFPDIGDRRAQARAIRDGWRLSSRFDDYSVVIRKGSEKIDPDSGDRDEVLQMIADARPPRATDLARFKLEPKE